MEVGGLVGVGARGSESVRYGMRGRGSELER